VRRGERVRARAGEDRTGVAEDGRREHAYDDLAGVRRAGDGDVRERDRTCLTLTRRGIGDDEGFLGGHDGGWAIWCVVHPCRDSSALFMCGRLRGPPRT
jgi:hypothetical protein